MQPTDTNSNNVQVLDSLNTHFTQLALAEERAKDAKKRKDIEEKLGHPFLTMDMTQSDLEIVTQAARFNLTQSIRTSNIDATIQKVTSDFRKTLVSKEYWSSFEIERAMSAFSKKIEEMRQLPAESHDKDVMVVVLEAQKAAMATLKTGADNTRSRMRLARVGRLLDVTIDSLHSLFEAKMKRIEAVLKLEEKGLSRGELMSGKLDKEIDKQISCDEQAKNQTQEKIVKELLQEKAKKKKKIVQKQERVAVTTHALSKEEETADLPIAVVESKVDLRAQHALTLYKRKSRAELARVTRRWQASVSDIRAFVDTKPDQTKVRRYAHLTDDEVEKWRAFHYLPGTEKIFSQNADKNIYTFATKRGLAMIGELSLANGKHFYGTLAFGINEQGTIYHRCFEPLEVKDLPQALLLDPEALQDLPEDTQQWQSTVPYAFTFTDKGAITVAYQEYGHSITIMPVRSDLLRNQYERFL